MRKINTIFKFPEAISYSWTLRHFQGVIQPSSMQAVDMRGQSLLLSLIWQRCLPLLKAEKNAEQVPNSNFANTWVRDVIHHYLLSVSHTQSWKWKNGLRSKRSGSPEESRLQKLHPGAFSADGGREVKEERQAEKDQMELRKGRAFGGTPRWGKGPESSRVMAGRCTGPSLRGYSASRSILAKDTLANPLLNFWIFRQTKAGLLTLAVKSDRRPSPGEAAVIGR